jgi:hypothetical protein
LGHGRHKNAQKWLRQAVWDFFVLILGTFRYFLRFLPILLIF